MLKVKDKIERFLLKLTDIKILYYIVPALLIFAYLFELVQSGGVRPARGYYVIHYLFTFDHGFVARGFIGEILSWFFDTITDNVTKGTIIVGDALLGIASALCIGRSLSLTRDNKKHQIFVFGLLLAVFAAPFTLRNFFTDCKIDTFAWAVALIAVFLSDFKIGMWFVPAMCVLASLVSPVFLFTSMILVCLILLQKFHDSGMSKAEGAICVLAYLGIIAVGIFDFLAERKLGFSSPKELVEYYYSRYYMAIDSDTMNDYCTVWLYDYFDSLPVVIQKAFKYNLIESGMIQRYVLNFIFFVIPVDSLFAVIWIKAVKNTDDKFQKFIFFLCLISPLVSILPIILSWEVTKYFQSNMLVQAGMVIWYVCHNNTAVTKALHDLSEKCMRNPVITACVVMYLAMFEF